MVHSALHESVGYAVIVVSESIRQAQICAPDRYALRILSNLNLAVHCLLEESAKNRPGELGCDGVNEDVTWHKPITDRKLNRPQSHSLTLDHAMQACSTSGRGRISNIGFVTSIETVYIYRDVSGCASILFVILYWIILGCTIASSDIFVCLDSLASKG
jgi:hypothetical protein